MLHVALSPRSPFQVAIRASAGLEPVAIGRKPRMCWCGGIVRVLPAHLKAPRQESIQGDDDKQDAG